MASVIAVGSQEGLYVISWEIFKKELLARFGPTKYEDFDEVLSEIKQMETMRDYWQEFEWLANHTNDWS